MLVYLFKKMGKTNKIDNSDSNSALVEVKSKKKKLKLTALIVPSLFDLTESALKNITLVLLSASVT